MPNEEKRFRFADMMSEGGEALSRGLISGLSKTTSETTAASSLISAFSQTPAIDTAVSE